MRPEQIDETGGNVFAIAMKNKMRIKREQGVGGWYDSNDCTTDDLVTLFNQQLQRDKLDWVDIGNFAMMIWNREMK